ncbi:MAG TPA: spermidine/putrescine ABC transporter substrate-binding protein [Bryobacteraceae bacterium]|nr:spermidine/putrescine ABC transporter substrate-binding protein [Bryobacteraceae bacterium]
MNRRTFLLGIGGASAGCMRGPSRRLNIYNWSDYVAHDTIPNFEREFGVRVRYATYESTEEMLAKALTGNSGWDVVFPSNSYVGPMREMDLLAQLDHRQLPNLVNLDVRFQTPPWDRQIQWSVPYMHGSTGIVYSTKAPRPVGWADLWEDKYQRRLTMLDDPAEVLGACLKRRRDSVNSTDPGQLEAAKQLAIEQKPLLRAYINAEVRDQLIAGDVLAAQSWSVTAQQAIEQSDRLAFVYPEEGFPLYCDTAAILRESRRVDLAHQFLNYLLRPHIAAAIALEMRTATVNAAARALLPEKDRNNATLYPGPEILQRGEWFRAMPPAAQRLRDRLWTEIKSA